MVGLRARISENPKDADAWCQIGLILLGQGNEKEAEDVFQRVVQLDDKQYRAWAGLGLIAAKMDRLREAEECYKKAVKINSDFDDAWIALARIYLHRKKFKDAEKAFKKCKPKTPDRKLLLAMDMGFLYLSWEKFSKAEEEYRKALVSKPDDIVITMQLVGVLNRQGKKEGGEIESEIMKGPHSVEKWFELALYWKARAMQEKDSVLYHVARIVEVCNKILEIDPDNIHARLLIYEVRAADRSIYGPLKDLYYSRPYETREWRKDERIKTRMLLMKLGEEIVELVKDSDDEAAKKKWAHIKIDQRTLETWPHY